MAVAMCQMERRYTRNKKDADCFAEMTLLVDPGLLEQKVSTGMPMASDAMPCDEHYAQTTHPHCPHPCQGRGKLLDMVRELGVHVSVTRQPAAGALAWQRTTEDCDLELARESGACDIADLPRGVVQVTVWPCRGRLRLIWCGHVVTMAMPPRRSSRMTSR
jgi:hypothetical protein